MSEPLTETERARAERAELLITHLGSWRDRAGACHDLTNPEAQVQSIIDAYDDVLAQLAEAQALNKRWNTEMAEAEASPQRAIEDSNTERAILERWREAERQLTEAQAHIAELETFAHSMAEDPSDDHASIRRQALAALSPAPAEPRREVEQPVCPGCTEANGTDGWAVVRHDPPLCKTNAEDRTEKRREEK